MPIPSEGHRALSAAETAAAATEAGFETVLELDSPLSAVSHAVERAPPATTLRVVVCGSLYLAGWVLKELEEAAGKTAGRASCAAGGASSEAQAAPAAAAGATVSSRL